MIIDVSLIHQENIVHYVRKEVSRLSTREVDVVVILWLASGSVRNTAGWVHGKVH